MEGQLGAWQVAIHFECLGGCYFVNNNEYREHEVSALDYGFRLDCVMALNQAQRQAFL